MKRMSLKMRDATVTLKPPKQPRLHQEFDAEEMHIYI